MILIEDIRNHACGPDKPIREVLQRLDASPHLFQIVVDGAKQLLGTITDGDIRRAMLQGVALEDPATSCMQVKPMTGDIHDQAGNVLKMARLGSSRSFLPLLNKAGVVEAILVDHVRSGIAQALVMAGGFGRRLGERTRETPKPLLPVGDRPMLDHVLSALEQAGIGQVHVAVHHLADQIKSFVAGRTNRAEIHIIEEDAPLGTAGALGRLHDGSDGPVLVVNGDVLTGVDYGALHDFHHRHVFDATVAVARYDIDVPFGVVRYDEDGLFAGIEEKPRVSNFVAAGVYYLGPEFAALVPRDELIDMPELLKLGRQIGLKIGLFPIHEYWADVGSPDDLEAADAAHADNGAPFASLGAIGGASDGSGSRS